MSLYFDSISKLLDGYARQRSAISCYGVEGVDIVTLTAYCYIAIVVCRRRLRTTIQTHLPTIKALAADEDEPKSAACPGRKVTFQGKQTPNRSECALSLRHSCRTRYTTSEHHFLHLLEYVHMHYSTLVLTYDPRGCCSIPEGFLHRACRS